MVLTIIMGFAGLVLIVLSVAYTINIYNQLVSLQKRVDQAKQNIDVLLKQRRDELTKLIDAATEFMEQEEEVLMKLTKARERIDDADSPKEQANADEQLKQALVDFQARSEEYPEIKSHENVMQLQDRIANVESQIADRREVYNEAVTQNNTRIKQFPYVLFARQFGFGEKELFEASEEEKRDVDISKAFNN